MQQSAHQEQVGALWHRLEAASEGHKLEVLQLQEKLQELAGKLEQRDTVCQQARGCFSTPRLVYE